ncbi:hypothetical protein BDP55DRAFT_752919 [Colletotrichum godetiae]|uniref:Uncharacterized protein n=1 Tax=Colletotrichum godetiae TaxID=1209918 RepID=A0AAJ0ERK4_9PEZI|nr:uncharacterized protein BDP55DRAFT_752919 [Colletotrichum godetiae]KAK1671438.1 hypothetical protein BDP55DRAFT_752919 [Colletotrichum godetiae]
MACQEVKAVGSLVEASLLLSARKMDSLKTEETIDTNYLIRSFLSAATGESPHVGASLVARLTDGTITVFQDINKLLIDRAKGIPESHAYAISLGRSSDRLRLWSDGYGISSGASDDIFERSSRLRGATLEILCSIGSTLTERLIPSAWVTILLGKTQLSESATNMVEQLRQLIQEAEDDHPKSESSTGSSEYDDDDIMQITADLETDTQSLMDLDGLFSEPILDAGDNRESIASSLHKWELHEPYKQLISKRFPNADDNLIISLGKANYNRFLRGQKRRNKRVRALLNGSDLLHEIRDSDATSSKFQDSGLGSSVPSSYAETIMSYHGDKGSSVRLPPLPKSAMNGSSFLCIACGKPTIAQTKSAWKRHLYNDLKPWQCLEPSCRHKGIFRTRGDWISHLSLDHFGLDSLDWKESECPLCRKNTGRGTIAILNHLGGHLEEISLAALPSNPDSDTESQPSDTSQQEETVDLESEKTNAAQVGDAGFPHTADDGQSSEPIATHLSFNTTIHYINEFVLQEPELYDEFRPLIDAYQNKSMKFQEFYARATDILSNAPELKFSQYFLNIFAKLNESWPPRETLDQILGSLEEDAALLMKLAPPLQKAMQETRKPSRGMTQDQFYESE